MGAYPYDLKFTVASGPNAGTYGFMCVTPPGETKTLNFEEVAAPEANRISGEAAATYADFDPRVDTPFVGVSWVRGAGQLERDDGYDEAYWWGAGVVTHVDGKAYLAPPLSTGLTVTGAGQGIDGMYHGYDYVNDNHYDFAWSGTKLYRRPSDVATAWTLVYTASFPITDFKVFNNEGLIACPTDDTNDFYAQSSPYTTAATWTPTARNHTALSSGSRPKQWIPVRGTCFALVDTRKVFYSVDPSADGWAGPIDTTVSAVTADNVGDTSYPFVNGIAVNDYVFAFKSTSGYSIDAEQNITETFWQWNRRPSALNFKYVAAYDNFLVFTIGNEMYAYDPGTGATFPADLSRRSGFSMREILGMDADGRYVYVLARVRVPVIHSAESVALLRLHRDGIDWRVECLWEDTAPGSRAYQTLRAMPTATGTKLYVCSREATTTITQTMDIPEDWDESSAGSFTQSAYLVTSITRSFFPGLTKRHLWLGAEADNLGSTETLSVHYSVDFGATFESLVAAAESSPIQQAYTNENSKAFALKFTFAGDGTATPILRTFDHHQRVRFRYLPAITAGVRIATGVANNVGTPSSKKVDEVFAELAALRSTDEDILYEDFLGNSFKCSVDVFNFRPTRHETPADKHEIEALILINRADAGA